MKKFLITSFLLILFSCSDEQKAKEILEENGYSDVQVKGYSFFGCSKDDIYHTEFEAKAPNGKTVSGTVCKGFFKGSTIRFD